MNRRELLKGIGLLLGGSISAPVASALLGCDRPRAPIADWKPRTLDASQHRLVAAIAETILPATDTPGATEAGVDQFIDLLLTDWLDPEDVESFVTGLAEIETLAVERTGTSFVELEAERQLDLLEPLDRDAVALRQADDEDADLPFLARMKEMTLVGYYTSEVGMTVELRRPEVTGSFAGCIPFEEVGRSWA